MAGHGAVMGDARQLSANYFSGGFLRERQVRRILDLAGLNLRLGLPPKSTGQVVVWGRTPRAYRGRWIAQRRGAGLITVEDGFIRSVLTGRAGAPPQGLVIDHRGIYFDCSRPSDLEHILNFSDLDGPNSMARSADALARYQMSGLSKYNNFDPARAPDQDGYILVVDQTRGDASITLGGATPDTFAQMLRAARDENPGKTILIKTHPEVALRRRRGYFSSTDIDVRTKLVRDPIAPARMLQGADKVYCVTSLMGFEAILAGHRPRVFGKPFYGGWGLSDDEHRFERRNRTITALGLFTGAMLMYPTWYDIFRDEICDFETLVDNIEAQARAHHEDCHGYMAMGFRLWKRGHMRRFFRDAGTGLSFQPDLLKAADQGRRGLIWAGKETQDVRDVFAKRARPLSRLEDGFIRSRGLGADLVAPLSLVIDDLGIYFDASRESRLERLLNASADLPPFAQHRAEALIARLTNERLTKYNLSGRPWSHDKTLLGRKTILVPGQVEDDASIRLGCGDIRTNSALLAKVRAENPDAVILYKPHPDVEAGLRLGKIDPARVLELADADLAEVDPVAAIDAADEIWTMTSLLGFEALLRGKKVTCLGAPFYAGWGLTTDLGPPVARRIARPTLAQLAYCALIAYPRYFDPQSGLACPVEVVVDRLASGQSFAGGGLLAKLQGLFAGFAPLWR